MRKKLKKSKGITLIALIITIIILLILAGISISALTQTGIFSRAKQAEQKSKDAQEEENSTLGTYENEINKYLDKNSGETPSEPKEIKLVDKVKDGTIKIGDYVKYTPDTVTNTDKSYTDLLSNLTTYSGNTDSTKNTTSTLTQEKLNWRVLDITDDGQVRLISELPTTSTIALRGYNGYNNAVKLLDDTCSTLYTNKKLANKVQNIKIEDIQDKMKEKDLTKIYTDYGATYNPENIKYPKILEQEENQTVVNSTTDNKLKLSSQETFVNGSDVSATSTLKYTFWSDYKKIMSTNDYKDGYYNLFINNGNNYDIYWMSSRCITTNSIGAGFRICNVNSGYVFADSLCFTYEYDSTYTYAFRPVITLNSDIQIDTANSGDGSTAAQGYAIK